MSIWIGPCEPAPAPVIVFVIVNCPMSSRKIDGLVHVGLGGQRASLDDRLLPPRMPAHDRCTRHRRAGSLIAVMVRAGILEARSPQSCSQIDCPLVTANGELEPACASSVGVRRDTRGHAPQGRLPVRLDDERTDDGVPHAGRWPGDRDGGRRWCGERSSRNDVGDDRA